MCLVPPWRVQPGASVLQLPEQERQEEWGAILVAAVMVEKKGTGVMLLHPQSWLCAAEVGRPPGGAGQALGGCSGAGGPPLAAEAGFGLRKS